MEHGYYFFNHIKPRRYKQLVGYYFHVLNALKKKHNAKVIDPNMLTQVACFCQENFYNRGTYDNYPPVLGSLCTEQINRLSNCDLFFWEDLYLVPFLELNIPIVHFSDVNYHLFKDYLNYKEEIRMIETKRVEKELLNKYTTIIYSSEWIH